ncbi:MAG: glycoside hydrolase [Candidatus Bathyarchaeota archaeon]|nr:glycoside hydrolase [Candidatus Bathyarchaeota archaeon]
MTCFRYGLVLFFIIIASMSNICLNNSMAGGGAEDDLVQGKIQHVSGFPEVLEEGGCFGVSTRILGTEGAFAVIATDDAGGVYVAYQSQYMENNSDLYLHVYFAYSHDYGETWSESSRIDDEGSSSVQCDSPSIAIDQLNGHVYVAWKDNRTGVAKVYIDKSVDRGVSFGSDVMIYDWPHDHVFIGLPRTVNIEVGNDGKIYVAWMVYDGYSLTDCDIFFAWSVDGGHTFNAPTNVNPLEGEARHSHPWIEIDEGNSVYVAYTKRNSTVFCVYLARSQNGGSSFEAPVKVNDDSTNRYRGGPQVVTSQDGKIHLAWTDGRAGDGTQYLDIYYAVSSDGGLTFGSNVRVNDDSVSTPPDAHPHFTRGAQGTPSIVADSDSRVHVVWEDFRNYVHYAAYCRDIYYSSSEDTTFTKNLRANSVTSSAESVDCADPNMAIDSRDNLFIAYSDRPSGDNGHHEIYYILAPSAHAASDDDLSVTVDWDMDYYYQGDPAGFTTTITSRSDNQLGINRFEIRFEWQEEGYCYALFEDEPVNLSKRGDSKVDVWSIDIPPNVKVGDIPYHTTIYYDEYISGEWEAYGYWKSDIRHIDIHSIHEKTYYDSHDEIYAQILSLQDLDLVNSDSITSFNLAREEYNLSTFHKDEDLFEDAVNHLLQAEHHIVEAQGYERNHWKENSENIISRIELGLEGIGNVSDLQSLDLHNQTLEKIIQAESCFDEDTIQGYRDAFSIAQEAELLFEQLVASIGSEPEPEQEPQPEPEPGPEPEEEAWGISGFPLEAIILGIILSSTLARAKFTPKSLADGARD